MYLKQSTSASVMLGPFVDASDGVSEEEALSPTVQISKGASSFTSMSDGATAHDTDGWYTCSLDTTDTNTLGTMILKVHSSSAHLPVWHEYEVVPSNVYDSILSTDKLQVDAVEISSDSTAADNLELITEISNITSLTVNASGHLEANAVEISDDATAANDLELFIEALGTDDKVLISTDAQDLSGTLDVNAKTLGDNAITSAKYDESTAYPLKSVDSGSTQVARVGGDGDTLETLSDQIDGAATPAEVDAEVDEAIENYGLDHLLSTSVTGTDITDNSIIAKLVSSASTSDWDTFDNTTEALQALRDHIGDGTNLTEAGGTGDQLTAIPWNSDWDVEVESEVDDSIESYHLDHLLAVDYDPSSKPGVATALLNELIENDGGVSRYTANALEAITDDDTQIDASALNALTGVSNISSLAVDTSGYVKSNIVEISDDATAASDFEAFIEALGTDDKVLISTDAQDLSGSLDVNTKTIRGSVATDQIRDAVLSDATKVDGANLNTLSGYSPDNTIADVDDISGISYPSVASIADGVWDETSTGHTDAGKAGAQLWTDIDAILTDTGTDGVVLADDAITSAKYDETTAYPLKSADSGSTQVARVGADGDTLETLSDQIDDTATPAEVDSEVDEAIENYGLDHLVSASVIGTDITDNSIIAKMVSSGSTADWDDFDNTTDSLQAIKDTLLTSADVLSAVTDDDNKLDGSALNTLAGYAPDNTIADVDDVSAVSSPSLASISDAVWDETQADHTSAGTTGESLNDSGASASDIADAVWDETISQHVSSGSTGESLDNAGSGASASDIADAVWNEQSTGHTDAGKAGEQLWTDIDAILTDTGTDGVVLADDAITSAKYDELTAYPLESVDSGSTKVARTGADSDTLETLSDEIATVDGNVDSVLDDTGTSGVVLADDAITSAKYDGSTAYPLKSVDSGSTEIARTGADGDTLETLSDEVETVDGNVDSILADTNELQSDDVPGLIAALNDLSASDVNAEVLDVLNTDTFSELTGVPNASATLTQMLRWLYSLARNKITQTSSTQTLRNDADTGDMATSSISDDGATFVRGEWS